MKSNLSSYQYIGNLKKMDFSCLLMRDDSCLNPMEHSFFNINYTLGDDSSFINLNHLIGKKVKIQYNGVINCVHCNKVIKESYNSGYCEQCNSLLAECDKCSLLPAICSYHKGGCRDNKWGEKNCLKSHIVYLSYTGDFKVGISRHAEDYLKYNSPSSRWIDQGSTSAIPFLLVKERLYSGLVEEVLKAYISDRTNWRKMLQHQEPQLNIIEFAKSLKEKALNDIAEIQSLYGADSVEWINDPTAFHISYPVLSYPKSIKSHNLDKEPILEGVLSGIKGQYLIFEDGKVINFRKYAGYKVEITSENF